MESECFCRFVLLDFGHPMNSLSINNVINSLQNVLALVLAFPRNTKEIHFGITILNSDFMIFETESQLRRNYDLVVKNLTAAMKTAQPSNKVTVQEYKYLLSNSIEAVLRELQKFVKRNNVCGQLINPLIQIAVVTKKTASILVDILKDVTNKLEKTLLNMPSVKNYKIVHIVAKQDNISLPMDKNMLIDWTTCSDNIYNLNCFFKEWLLSRQQLLKILLSKELNLEIHCDVYDCILNPVTVFDGKLDLFNDINCITPRKNSFSGILNRFLEVEIINRLPTNCFCSTFLFGIPRRISATQSQTLQWTESEINTKIFKQLCRELHQTGEGLLAKSVLTTCKEEIYRFHLLTSDENILLMNDVAPEELYLPTRDRFSDSVDSLVDESAASMITTCFEKIQRLDEYNPKYHPSGVYQHLKNYFLQYGQNKSFLGHFDSIAKSFGRKSRKKEDSTQISGATDYCNNNSTRKKRQKMEMELENIHPALLSENVVQKYRKINSQAFKLPELSNKYE